MQGKRWVSSVIFKGAPAALLLLLVLWGRVFYGSMEDYKTGETLLKENQTVRAITYFDRSLHWYAPLNPYVERSAKRLWEIGEKAEKEGDIRVARIAFESIRNAGHGTSHIFNPGGEWIGKAEAKIRRLESEKAHGGYGQGEVGDPKKSPHPHPGWSVTVVLGFLGWVGSALGFIVSVLRKTQGAAYTFGKGLAWVSVMVGFAALWVVGMVMA